MKTTRGTTNSLGETSHKLVRYADGGTYVYSFTARNDAPGKIEIVGQFFERRYPATTITAGEVPRAEARDKWRSLRAQGFREASGYVEIRCK